MPSYAFDALDERFRGSIKRDEWTLCVGAGIGSGILPNWEELTRRVVNQSFGTTLASSVFHQMVQSHGWSLDAWFQSALNAHRVAGRDEADFAELLATELYSDVMRVAADYGLEGALADALSNHKFLRRDRAIKLGALFDTQYEKTTLVRLAKLLRYLDSVSRTPRGVVSFNADSLLFAVMGLFQLASITPKGGVYPFPKERFGRILRSIQTAHGLVPIVYVHGCLVPSPKRAYGLRRRDSRDRLVFDEGAYLRLAGEVSNWAQITFLAQSYATNMVFVGHSLADSNVRRWLAWAAANRSQDIAAQTGRQYVPMCGVWITKRPDDKASAQILTPSLRHLGLRIAWIDSWDDVIPAIANLLGISLSAISKWSGEESQRMQDALKALASTRGADSPPASSLFAKSLDSLRRGETSPQPATTPPDPAPP